MPRDNLVVPTTSRWLSCAGASRFVAALLAASLATPAQQPTTPPAATLRIRPVNGEKLQASIPLPTFSKLIVVVEDHLGVPIPLATVSFRLPDSPLGGLFANGLRTEIATTGSDGRASSSAVQWPSTPVAVRVIAAKDNLRAGVVIHVEGLKSASAQPAAPAALASADSASPSLQGARPERAHPPAPLPAGQPDRQNATQATTQPATQPAAEPTTPSTAPSRAKSPPKPIVLGASIATKPPATLPADLVVPKYEPPSFWRSKWFLVGVSAGGALAAGFFAARPRSPGASAVATPVTPGGGGAISLPVTIGPPTVIIGKP